MLKGNVVMFRHQFTTCSCGCTPLASLSLDLEGSNLEPTLKEDDRVGGLLNEFLKPFSLQSAANEYLTVVAAEPVMQCSVLTKDCGGNLPGWQLQYGVLSTVGSAAAAASGRVQETQRRISPYAL